MSEPAVSKAFEDSIPHASLESILCTEELQRRPSRPPDYEKETRAFVALVSALADSPSSIFQTLAETIHDIAQCDSAGLSLLTIDGKTPHVDGQRFYWPAISGMWSPHVGGGTPRNFGPCGEVLDQNRTLMFRHFERRYPYLMPVVPAAEECLLVPFYVMGKAVGTIWAIMHSDRRKFDAEDDRIMASLGKFASSAYQAWTHIKDVKIQVSERERAEPALRKLTEGLEEQVQARTAELQRSEEWLRLAHQAAHIGAFEWNIQTGVNTWTRELEAMYGLPPGGFGGTQADFENLVHPDDRGRVIELDNWALKTGQPTTGEWRVVWADGSIHWIAGRWQVFMNESGKPSRMVGINIDISDRKLAEQELSKANERLRLAIESSSIGGWDYNLKTGKKVWFGETHAQLGLASDEAPGSFEESWNRIHQDDREHLQYALREAKDKHKQFTEEFRVVWRDGTTRWLRSRGRFFYAANGEPERLVGLSVDITQSKQAEQALREQSAALRSQEELLKTFVKNVPAAVAMLDRDMRYLQVSDRWCTDYLSGREQVVGRSHYEIFPDMPERWKEVHSRGLQGETLRADEDRWDGQDGPHWARWEVRPWKTPKGIVGGILILTEDITRRKQMEEMLSSMTRKLIDAQEQERARIGRELHDDINQRLAMLALELEQLQGNPSEVESRVRELRKRTAEISDDVQALSHELHSSKLEYLGVVKGIRSWCNEFGDRQRIEIEFKSDVMSVLPLEVGVCLFRVLQEALHNVVKHSGEKRVEVQLAEHSNEIQLIVRDSGRGFDIEAARQCRGLGLNSMQERVRLVGGTFGIESEPMGGTTIRVCIPVNAELAAQRAAG